MLGRVPWGTEFVAEKPNGDVPRDREIAALLKAGLRKLEGGFS